MYNKLIIYYSLVPNEGYRTKASSLVQNHLNFIGPEIGIR